MDFGIHWRNGDMNKKENLLKLITFFLWGVLFLYLSNFFDIKKNNIAYFLIGFPLFLSGGLLIFYMFERKSKNNAYGEKRV
ncbi:hypothetical protein PB01_15095 [Psychrobacillus glaciei]|uniref:Uncharacterized protein n=1 Tax=Psychrobacillus glaciei TaxID=2283160 RepID=A0A5J6SRC6_9BACI|nr:hypothetical protein PB01_15095 [Psychrobacillus glaciei]